MTNGDPATDTDLLRKRWGLTSVVLLERLQTYPTRLVERIVSDQGCFAVKYDHAPDGLVEGSERVQASVARTLPRHVPSILPDRSGALYVVDQGRRITVHQDISGGRPASSTLTWSGLGSVLAGVHAVPHISRAFAIPVQAAADELDRLADDYPFADEIRSLSQRVRRIRDHPAAAIHGEVNLSNVRRRPDGDLVLLDWDAAGAGPIALDLGYPLICVFHGEGLTWRADLAAAFYAAYAESSSAVVPAPEQIFDAALMHALRYLRFGDSAKRWARVRYAVGNEPRLVDFLTRVLGSS